MPKDILQTDSEVAKYASGYKLIVLSD
jgi:hypothetical protein